MANVKNVFIQIEKDLWKAAKVLAAQQERPVKVLVAEGLRLLLEQDQAEDDASAAVTNMLEVLKRAEAGPAK